MGLIRKTLLLAGMLALVAGCSDEYDEPSQAPLRNRVTPDSLMAVLQKDSLRILDIGNSYTEDVTAFLPLVVSASGVDVSTVGLYRAVRGKGSFKSWYDLYNRNDAAYSITKVLGGIGVATASGDFDAESGEAFRELLQQTKWDIIILHQVSTYAPYCGQWFYHGEGGYLGELLSLLMELQPQALLGFYVIHSLWSGHESNFEHSTFSRWQLTVSSVDFLVQNGICDLVIPYGTAIENLRLSSMNNAYDLTRDGTHLEFGLARYAAACCYYESVFAPRYGVSMVGQTFRWNGRQQDSDYPVISVDELTSGIAQKTAAAAVADWHHCCNPETDE